jgi:hypothetical protein
MKGLNKYIFVLVFSLISTISFSQTTLYGGVWRHQDKARPYLFIGTGKNYGYGFTYTPILGLGYNSENKVSGLIGFDTEFGYSKVQPVAGFGVELFGYDRVYQDFMPNFRLGLKAGRFRILSSLDWKFKNIETKLGPAFQPISKITYGLFYDFK